MANPRKMRSPGGYFTSSRTENDATLATDRFFKEADRVLEGHEKRIVAEELQHPRVMPVNSFYYAHWPCDDPAGSTVLRQAISGGPGALVCSSSALPGYIGLPTKRCVRVYNDTGTPANMLATVSPSPPTMAGATVALWCRFGISENANKNVFGWRDSTGPTDIFGIYKVASATGQHIPGAYVNVGGVQYTASAPGEAYLSSGEWHHIGCTYDSQTLLLYVDGNAISSNGTPNGAINWTAGGGTDSWRLGPSSANMQSGFYADIRVVSGAMPAAWFEEAYRRGMGVSSVA